jgi:xylulokinase
MTRAVLEGVAMNLRIILEAFADQGARPSALRVIGGGARSSLWRQILADVLGLPLLRVPLFVEATSLGAAIAGGVGAGLFPDYASGAAHIVTQPGEEPREHLGALYDEVYALFLRAYERLVPVFADIAGIQDRMSDAGMA